MNLDLNYISNLLKKESLRITKSRQMVAEILILNKDKYLSSDDIHQKILLSKNISCDQASVYRTLASFEKIGIIKKSSFYNDASRYKLDESFGEKASHEHYFKCNKCSSIEAFSDCFISKKEKELEKNGYRNLSHHLEITGFCPSCV